MQGKMNTFSLLVKVETGTATREISVELPQNTKSRFPYDPDILLLGVYPKDFILYS